ncbi:hypothetical protein PVAP13_9KG567801 [Panicum virgatum]|uniref:Uncharacterized protein n=1 Tax=Panicum virgatum TaxID=38727 RepID=A0A8T0NZ84_PANVG|nr:hypothetical protein PVAP13_9KG567801 [Panicum virgatum]
MLALKRHPRVEANVSRIEEVEEPLDPALALACANDPAGLSGVDSPIVRLVTGEDGVGEDAAPFTSSRMAASCWSSMRRGSTSGPATSSSAMAYLTGERRCWSAFSRWLSCCCSLGACGRWRGHCRLRCCGRSCPGSSLYPLSSSSLPPIISPLFYVALFEHEQLLFYIVGSYLFSIVSLSEDDPIRLALVVWLVNLREVSSVAIVLMRRTSSITTYKATQTVLHQLYKMNLPSYTCLYNYVLIRLDH